MPVWNNSRNNKNNNNSNPNSGDPYAPPPPKDMNSDNDDDDCDDGDDTDAKDYDFTSILAPYTPLLQKLTLSSFLGYCSAITAKRIGKSLAFTVGLGFMVCQGLVYKGFVNVDWKQVEKSVAQVVDTDNDGEITKKDIQRYFKKAKSILTNKIPDASGFSLGFMVGLRG